MVLLAHQAALREHPGMTGGNQAMLCHVVVQAPGLMQSQASKRGYRVEQPNPLSYLAQVGVTGNSCFSGIGSRYHNCEFVPDFASALVQARGLVDCHPCICYTWLAGLR